MVIHHLNCGTLRPYYPKIQAVVYCLLVETNEGLVLVDTGFGSQDFIQPSLLMKEFMRLLNVPQDIEQTASKQIINLGYDPDDVKHIVMTHLHVDHAGGLPDFPNAQIHVCRGEYEAMKHHKGVMSRICEKAHFKHGPSWVFHEFADETWYGYKSTNIQEGLKPVMHLIYLPGHTRGHCGVAIATEEGWLLHCGDAISPFQKYADIHNHPKEMHTFHHMPKWFVTMVLGTHVDGLRALRRNFGDRIEIISSHDIYSYQKFHTMGSPSP